MKKMICCFLLGAMILTLFSCQSAGVPANSDPQIVPSSEIIPPDSVTDPPLSEKDLDGYISYESKNGTMLAPVLDIQGMFVHTNLTTADVLNRLTAIKEVGYTRVYIVVPGDGYPVFSAAWNTSPARDYLEANRKALGGDPLKAFVTFGHRMGLEMIAIYKIYEGGGGITIPEGKKADHCDVYESVPGGQRVYFDSFIQEHPEMRLCRRDSAHLIDENLPVTKIEACFLLDDIEETRRNGSKLTYHGISAAEIGTPKPELWMSADNGSYTQYTGDYRCTWTLEKRPIYDANGFLFASQKNVYVLTIDGMTIPENIKYFALLFSDADKEHLLTNPFSLLSLYSGNTKLVTGVSVYTREVYTESDTPENHVWGAEISPYFIWQHDYSLAKKTFSNWGFEFEYGGDGSTGTGWMHSNVFGLTRGKPQFLAGVLCEGYAEVRDYWMNYVKYLAGDLGFDGVDIRMLSHSGFVTDVVNYGYNEPIVNRYLELYGTDLKNLSEKITQEVYVRIMKIRGEFLTLFYTEASTWLHENGKLFIADQLAAYEDESMWNVSTYDLNQLCSPYQPRVLPDWRKLIDFSDEVILKDYHYSVYKTDLAMKVKMYAQEQGKPVWMHVYVGYDDATKRFVQSANLDPTINGLLWYEYNQQRQRDVFTPIISSIGFSRVEKKKLTE